MDRIERIAAGEQALDSAREVLDRFRLALDEFAAAQENVGAVVDYLGSEDWFDDMEAHAAGEVPRDVKAGILSEDLGYNLVVDNRDLAIRMLEIATEIMRDL